MNKRSFVRAGRFVELGWSKRAIEITEGAFGTPGETLDEILGSTDEVTYRIDREVERLVAAGYVEGESGRISAEEACAKRAREHQRPCAVPIFDNNNQGDPDGSRAGGMPWLAANDEHPRCKRCELPLQLVVQIVLSEVPLAIGEGLFQYFVCDRECNYDQGWKEFAESQCVRVIDPSGGALATGADELDEDDNYVDTHTLDARRITWQMQTDVPAPSTLVSLLSIDDDLAADVEQLLTYRYEKVGGWPYWPEPDGNIHCPTCELEMEHVMQLEQAVHGAEVVDGNIHFVVRCPKCAAMTSYQQH